MVNCCQCPQSLLVHKPILVPLLQLLQWCKQSFNVRHSTKIQKYPNSVVSNCLLNLINQIFRQIAEHETLLHFFFDSSLILNEDWAIIEGNNSPKNEAILNEQNLHKPFLIFDMLVPYLYGPEFTSQIARDALLLIMSASSKNEFIAEHIIQKGDLCHVMSAGLSACFSQLPKCVFSEFALDSNEAHKLSVFDVKGMPQLYEFHNALLFTNSVAQIAHYSITRQIVHFIYTGFLLKVFKSSIVESEPKEEELCSRIVYFHLCIETISASALLQAFIKILLTTSTNGEEKSEEEEMNLFEQILLCRVTLSLIRTLLSLHCEDFLWSTIFRHLLPFIQLRHPNQSRRFDANISLNSANYFLKCIPECAKNVLELCSEEQFETYLREAGKSIRDCEECCSCWALKYDGSLPKSLMCNPQKLINSEGMIVTPRQAFTRHSSARSSFASTGWNRYGHSNRSGRGTLLEGELESNNANLNSLGEDDEQLTNLIERLEDGNEVINNLSSQEEFGEASVLNENEDNRPDYFQFIYDRVSESDLDSFSRRNSEEDSQEEFLNNKKQKNILATKINNNSNSDSEKRQSNLSINLIKQQQQQPTLSPFMSAVVQTNWNEAKNDRNKFTNLLNLLPTRSSNNENKLLIEDLSLIDARWQHLEELRIEKLELTQQIAKEPNPFRLNLEGESGGGEEVFLNINGGILMKSTEEKGAGILLESLFDILSNLTENSFNTNIQLLGVFNLLFSYPQPLLTAYLFYVDSLRGNLPLLKLNDVSFSFLCYWNF
uniref:FHF complex subunit HOOK-interacting protein C-terminal domain-containing protein n=1 Tax=Meloidogyne javanica TaxID=6303 RepID=A0A915N4J0_MELJA